MRKISWFVACCFLCAAPSGFCQTPAKNKDGWGPWRYSVYWTSQIRFRSKCLSSSETDSKWAYQFRNWIHDSQIFVEREEYGLPDTSRNEWHAPQIIELSEAAMSPVFETQLHGTCATINELKIEVNWVTAPSQPIHTFPWFHDAQGAMLEFKPIPAHPVYE